MNWQILLYTLLGVSAVVCGLWFLPVGVRVKYTDSVLKIWCAAGPIRIPIDLKKKPKKKKKSSVSIRTVFNEPFKANRKHDSVLGDFWAELKTVLDLFEFVRPKLRISYLMLKLSLAAEDPYSVAMQYGGAWAAVGALIPLLEETFILKKRDISVEADFSGGDTRLDAKLHITIALGSLLYCLLRYGMGTSNKSRLGSDTQ